MPPPLPATLARAALRREAYASLCDIAAADFRAAGMEEPADANAAFAREAREQAAAIRASGEWYGAVTPLAASFATA